MPAMTNEAATQVSVTIDKKKPTLTITPPDTDQKEAFDVTFTFNEAVTGFIPRVMSPSPRMRRKRIVGNRGRRRRPTS